MLSLRQCKRITDDRPLCFLLSLGLGLFALASMASEAEAMELKRAGFVGMRGKKSMENLYQDMYDTDPSFPEVKRSGFVGMRGKKSSSRNSDVEDLYEVTDPMYFMEKRAGFVGMRGKKFQTLPSEVSRALYRVHTK